MSNRRKTISGSAGGKRRVRWATAGCRGLLAALLLATGAAGAAAETGDGVENDSTAVPAAEPSAGAAETRLPRFDIDINGVGNRALRDLLKRSSESITLRDNPPATVGGLARRATGDLERFDAVLRSEGYYDSHLSFEIDEAAEPPQLRFRVDPGPIYRLSSVEVTWAGPDIPPNSAAAFATDLGLVSGKPARASAIIAAERRIPGSLSALGRPLPQPVERVVTVDHRTRTMAAVFTVDPGPEAAFGRLAIVGADRTSEDYLRSLVPWQEGGRFDGRKVAAFRTTLLRSALFDTVIIDPAPDLDADGRIDLTLTVVEGDKRSVGIGGKYALSEGPAIELSWEHRSLFGSNEDLRLSMEVSRITQRAAADFVKPDFGEVDRDLLIGAEATHTNSEAFNELGVEGSSGVRWPIAPHWRITTRGSAEFSDLEDEKSRATALLVGLPVLLEYDGTDDRLNPTRGQRLTLSTTPYTGEFRGPATFIVNEIGGSAYHPVPGTDKWVIGAMRGKVASIAGESTQGVPANKREYAGGGGSIRGYRFQKVGPLDENNDPLGGRSLVEVGAELRIKVWGNLGVVPFVDGGTVFDDPLPDDSEKFVWGAGIGLRYLTAVGPARFDIAFPLNRRSSSIDDPFQIYLGLGQAF